MELLQSCIKPSISAGNKIGLVPLYICTPAVRVTAPKMTDAMFPNHEYIRKPPQSATKMSEYSIQPVYDEADINPWLGTLAHLDGK